MDQRKNQRRHERQLADGIITIVLDSEDGNARVVQGRGVDVSSRGFRMQLCEPLEPGTRVRVEAGKYKFWGTATVRHCTRRGSAYFVGLEIGHEEDSIRPGGNFIDYYEILQISPNAEPETIHRVYRIMAARFHPDNPDSGHTEKFILLTRAFKVLSDATSRAEYDAVYAMQKSERLPIFNQRDFIDDITGESNRRLGILCLLYNKRRNDPEKAGLSLLQLERLMSFPREYLTFTIWYLKQKQYLVTEDNSDFTITAEGIDVVEQKLPTDSILHKLIRPPTGTHHGGSAPDPGCRDLRTSSLM